jgi:uncharacterized membrane protein YqgA involved in biofilm formation
VRGLGTLLNLAAIVAGASVGALLGDRLPGRLRETLVAALGLFTLALGVQQALAAVLQQVMTPAVVAAMTAVGGLLVIAIGLRLLGLARIRVANLLPAVLLAPLATGLLTAVQRPSRHAWACHGRLTA